MSNIRAPDIKKLAKQDYLKGVKYKNLAEKYDVSINTIKSWVKRYGWSKEKKEKGAHKNIKGCTQNKNKSTKKEEPKLEEVTEIINNSELTEKQRLFCMYYIKSFNQTMSAIKAGYAPDSAHVEGSRLIRNVKVRNEIRKLKGKMAEEIFIDAVDILRKYVEIAFADINDFIEYGKKEIVVGKDEEGNDETALVNYVDFKESAVVDGTLIQEVSQGKNGVKIKLHDKMKALEKLEKYFDLLPDKFQRRIEEEKLKIAQCKLELEKAKVLGDNTEVEDDGFLEALNATVAEVWSDE